jgi:hypothetical protein
MFNVKKPCKDCPFVKGSITNQTLLPSRMKEIVHDVTHDGHFFCHKTIDYAKEKEHGDSFKPIEGEQLCAGSVLYIQRAGANTQFLEIMELLGEYDPSCLSGEELLIDPIK